MKQVEIKISGTWCKVEYWFSSEITQDELGKCIQGIRLVDFDKIKIIKSELSEVGE